MEEAAAIVDDVLSKPFDYSVDEDVVLEGDKLNYANSAPEIRERWRKKIKYLALERYADLLDTREKNKQKATRNWKKKPVRKPRKLRIGCLSVSASSSMTMKNSACLSMPLQLPWIRIRSFSLPWIKDILMKK
jgi:hypothetical protein